MTAGPGLNAGFFIRRQNKLIRLQGLSFPDALVKVEDASRFEGKLGISRKDPTTMVPRSDGIFMEPAPDGGFTNGRHQTRVPHVMSDIGHAQARERHFESGR